MAKIVLIGFSSRVQQEKIRKLFDEYSKEITPIIDVNLGLISTIDNLNRMLTKIKLEREDLLVMIILSGGTRNLIVEALKHTEQALLIINPAQNAWASALHAQYILKIMGKKVLSYIGEPSQIDWKGIVAILRAWKRIKAWAGKEIVLLGVGSNYTMNEHYNLGNLLMHFGLKVSTVSLKEFVQKVQDSKPAPEVIDFANSLPKEINDEESIVKIAKMFTAVNAFLEGRIAGGIRCFPIIMELGVTPCIVVSMFIAKEKILGCEADLVGLVTMMFAKEVSGTDPFIANPEFIDGKKLVLAHCTASYRLLKNIVLRKHFETGLPYAVQGEFEKNYVTILKISPDFSKILVVEGKIIAGKNFSNEFCRNQMIVELDEQLPDDFFNGEYAHHLVVIYGKNKDIILSIAKLLGLGE